MMTWRAPYLDIRAGLFIPCVVTWDAASGEFEHVEGDQLFGEYQAALEASRLLRTTPTPGERPMTPHAPSRATAPGAGALRDPQPSLPRPEQVPGLAPQGAAELAERREGDVLAGALQPVEGRLADPQHSRPPGLSQAPLLP